MKKILIAFLLFLSIIILLFICINNVEIQINDVEPITEYIPEEEIKKEEIRSAIVTLYYQNKSTKELQPEARNIDSKELVKEPYKTIINMLLEGPKKEQYESIINEETKLLDVKYESGIVTINFSKEFLNSDIESNDEKQIIGSITKTLKELNEVEYVRILIEGKENAKFNNGILNLSDKL